MVNIIPFITIVISFRPPCDHDTCPSNHKQVRNTWSLSELPSRSLWSIQIPSVIDVSSGIFYLAEF